ncbi:MAG TPA: CDP-glycerol glycerophosphotransferase family protein [Pyrinomonadaceae bacterium]|nr:CDP-glycerol glycerophosphotransferase family protein [Pyrinomonadaceae bacterium]
MREAGRELTVVTPADRVPSFVSRWEDNGVKFAHLHGFDDSKGQLARAMRFRKRLARRGQKRLLQAWFNVERKYLFPPHADYLELLRKLEPALVVATNATTTNESQVVSSAKALGIRTLGVVGSWDRMHKFLYTRTDHISVWNDLNRQEAIDLEGFDPAAVHVTGPAQFDPYFDRAAWLDRREFCSRLGLDPNRPIITLATAGSFMAGYDESYLIEWLMQQIDTGAIPGRPQVICRLHPHSRIEQFAHCADHPDLRISYMQSYIPTLGYTMTRDEVVQVGNMLRHSNLVVTPGSTMTIEAALFDTPVIVPVFHLYQEEMCEKYYRTRVFGRHFGRIQQRQLVPIVKGPATTLEAINRCLKDPCWMRTERRTLVEDYCQFTDGRSTRRLAELALQLASN